MCELCLPPITRRRALGVLGAAAAGALLGLPDPTAAARSFQTEYGVAIEPRSTWAGDSRPPLDVMAEEDVRFLLVHHTAGSSEGDPISLMRQVYDFHTGSDRGWPDVAYNFFVEPGGRVFEARAGSLRRAVEGSATGGSQGFAQLVCLLGDFTNRSPTDAQLRSLNETLAWLADRYGLDTSVGATGTFTSRGSNRWPAGSEVTADIISGHREMSETACPGDTFFPYLKDRVQAEVETLRRTPEPAPGDAAPPSTAEPQPDATTPTTTGAPTSTRVPTTTIRTSTVSPSGTEGPAASPPAPQADESAIDATGSATAVDDGRSSSNATAWVVGAGVATFAGVAGVYLAARGDSAATDVYKLDSRVGDQFPPPGNDSSG